MSFQQTSPLNERGGSSSGISQLSKNYMQYNDGGSYDDQDYSQYASSNYGHDQPTQPHHGGKHSSPPGFEVLRHQEPETSGQVHPIEQGGNYYICPLCKGLAVKTCGCPYRDAQCSNGHSWFITGGVKQLGIKHST